MHMSLSEAEQLFAKGLRAIKDQNTISALVHLERATQLDENLLYATYLAYCLARERGQVRKGIALCREAIEKEPGNSAFYLNLGRILLLDGDKTEALATFRQGLACEPNQEILDELQMLGPRKPPVVPFLSRNNPINKYLGIVLRRLGLR